MNKINHYILSFERRNSGAFEHSWGLAKNLLKKGENVTYYSHWFNSPIFEVDINTEETKKISLGSLEKKEGIFHLHTHTWEHDKLLEKISLNPNSKIIYYLHAVIPYYYLSSKEKEAFAKNNLPLETIRNTIKQKLSQREKAQLETIKKSDYIITINKSHKKILEFLEINKKISNFENISDFHNLDSFILNEGKKRGEKFKKELNKKNVLLYCGIISPKKGSFGLFNSFNRIKKNYPSSKLILLGNKKERTKNLLNLGLKKHLLEDILFVPWINKSKRDSSEEFLKYYFSSDVLIQPMITEELYSKTVIDAMSLGIPTITCKSPYTIGSSEDETAIYNSFKYLKENPEKVKKIIESAKEKTLKENTWEYYISNLKKIIL